MDNKKHVVCKSLSGEEITFIVKTLVSQWDQEQVDSIYMQYLKYDPEKKLAEFTGNDKYSEIAYARQSKLIEVMVIDWVRTEQQPLTVENIKKTLNATEYGKLISAIEEVYNSQVLSEEKKSLLPNDSLQA